jgi:NAD(P)-dependent dehydrogenase (short-subunit alcohol dehydrogenase family)
MPTNFTTTADDVLRGLDLMGRTYVVTGAMAGLGRETADALARAGADVVLAGRGPARLEAARVEVDALGSGSVRSVEVDLDDLESVRKASAELAGSIQRLDGLILNAGIMASPLQRSAQGHEMQLAVSHLGHFVLTAGLVDRLKGLAPSRVVSLSSSGHLMSGFDFDDPDFNTRAYDKWVAYAQAKTATILFTLEAARRLGPAGIKAFVVHPGVIKTTLQRHLSDQEETQVLAMSEAMGELRSVGEGAASIVYAAVSPALDDENGSYIVNAASNNAMRAPHAKSPDDANRLWALTEELTGESFPA